MNANFWKSLSAIAATIALAMPLASKAASLTQHITLAGTISPAPATCSFGASDTISFTGEASDYHGADGYIRLTCSNNAAYSLTTAQAYTPIKIGIEDAYVKLGTDAHSGGLYYDFRTHALTGVGTGTQRQIKIGAEIMGSPTEDSLDPSKHFGAVSGIVQLVLSY